MTLKEIKQFKEMIKIRINRVEEFLGLESCVGLESLSNAVLTLIELDKLRTIKKSKDNV